MKRILLSAIFAVLVCMSTFAQDSFKGQFFNQDLGITLTIDFYEKSIPVPGLEDLEQCYGYLKGNINGSWIILKVVKVEDNKALVRAASERGGDAQNLEFTVVGDEFIAFKQVDDTNIKGVEAKKYVKLPKLVEMRKM